MLSKLILKTGKIKSIKRYHPWVFSGAIKKIEGNIKNGDIVEIFSNHDEYLASGHYQEGTIAVRIFSFNRVTPDYEFWKSKIYNAYKLRDSLNLISNKSTNAYRLVFAEGDELPGLVIDFYNGVAVIQCHSVGMHNIIQDISQILQDIYKEKIIAIYDKSQNSLPTMNNNTYENKFLYGNIPNTTILENDFKFIVDFIEGQKTGFFIDQRENRTLIKNYSKDRKVLNLFSYTGAFSIYAAGSGAKFIYSVDSSAKAIDMAKKIWKLMALVLFQKKSKLMLWNICKIQMKNTI